MAKVSWCGACGAPLEVGAGWVVCRYCGCENRLDPDTDAWVVAAEEAREMARTMNERLAPFEAELSALARRIAEGDPEVEARILVVQETILRLTYAPTLHMTAALATSDRERTHAEIEAVIRKVLESWRRAFAEVRS